jgi:hypothetical protein
MTTWYNTGRFWKETSFAVDRSNLKGILVGGGPSLNKIDKSKLRGPGKRVFGLNNTYPDVIPDVWFGLDKAGCYNGRVFDEPFMKIRRGGFPDEHRDGVRLNSKVNTYYIDVEECDWSELFKRRDHQIKFVWHKNSMATAIHVMVWMGCKEIYLAGCDLDNTKNDYFNEVTLKKEHKERNANLYNELASYLEWLRHEAKRHGVSIYSISPESKINSFLEYVDLEDLNKEIETTLLEKGDLPYVVEVDKDNEKKEKV